jgi:glucose-6-phosphate-specific signal transduction histidine kinase
VRHSRQTVRVRLNRLRPRDLDDLPRLAVRHVADRLAEHFPDGRRGDACGDYEWMDFLHGD